jgi:hypothetical protein
VTVEPVQAFRRVVQRLQQTPLQPAFVVHDPSSPGARYRRAQSL